VTVGGFLSRAGKVVACSPCQNVMRCPFGVADRIQRYRDRPTLPPQFSFGACDDSHWPVDPAEPKTDIVDTTTCFEVMNGPINLGRFRLALG
jgi:hypothetical protein